MSGLVRDLRHALRGLLRTPGFSLAAVVTLALGIGANTAVVSMARGFIWRPLPVAGADRLASVFSLPADGSGYGEFSWADYRDLREGVSAFRDLVAYYPAPLGFGDGTQAERAWGEFVSGNYFAVLGLAPAAGRLLGEADDAPDAPPAIVLSWSAWQRRFRGDSTAVGRAVRINGRSFTVAGVAPRGFAGAFYPGFQPEFWLPAHAWPAFMPAGASPLEERGAWTFRILGHLRPGMEVAQAQAQAQAVASRLAQDHPATNAGLRAAVLPYAMTRPEPGMASGMGLAAKVFLGIVGLVLLVACVNVAGLLLARAAGRRREIAVRVALGATRARLVRQLLLESALLTVAGTAAGVLLAVWGTDLLASFRLPTDIPFVFDLHVDRVALAYTLAAAVVTVLIFGLVPALQASRPDLAATLRSEATAVARARMRRALVVGQIGVTSVLLMAAGLGLRTLDRTAAVDPGFRVAGGLLVTLSPSATRTDDAARVRFYRQIVEAVRAVPGARAASLTRHVPLEFTASGGPVFVEGRERGAGRQAGENASWNDAMPGYFAAMGMTLVAGRDFGPGDTAGAPAVVIVSRAAAARFWPGADPLGRRVRVGAESEPPAEVIGVVGDVKSRMLSEPDQPMVYRALAQTVPGSAQLVVRTGGDPLALAGAVRAAVASVDADVPVSDVKSMEQLINGRALILPKLGARLAAVFALLALVLATVGLYGLVAYSVTQRTREMGIRLALGAPRSGVLGLVLRDGLAMTVVGLAVGVPAALTAARVVRGFLFGVGPADPVTVAALLAVIVAVTTVAAVIPAVRAMRVDPVEALRSE